MESDSQWPFWPVRMRFHPLCRFVIDSESNSVRLEARLEFADYDGIITKAYGELTLRLFEKLPNGESGEVIEEWQVDLRDLEKNLEHFDDITHTYLFRLIIDVERLQPRMDLKGLFQSADGRLFDADFVFER